MGTCQKYCRVMHTHCREMKSVWVPFKETTSLPLSTPAITQLGGISLKSSSAFAMYFSWIVSLFYFPFIAKPCLPLFLAVLISHSKRISQKPKKNKQKYILAQQQKAVSHQTDLLDTCYLLKHQNPIFLYIGKQEMYGQRGFHFRNREYQRDLPKTVCHLNSEIKI